MPPHGLIASRTQPTQTPEQTAEALEAFLAQHPRSVLLEDGRPLFDLREAKYTLSTEYGRCILHLWSEDRNVTRRILSATLRNGVLRLSSQKFGQAKPITLELAADPDRRSASTREANRTRYLRLLARVLERHFTELEPEAFRTSMDLERSFGPAYARGSLVRGQQAWAVVAINAEESQATIDGILSIGILWLAHCRAHAEGNSSFKTRRLYNGLKLILPAGTAATTLSRLPWLDPALANYKLYELDERSEDLTLLDPTDNGNFNTRLIHAPNPAAAQGRFSEAIRQVLDLLPAGTLIHGLEPDQHASPASVLSREVEKSGAEAQTLPATRSPLLPSQSDWIGDLALPAHTRNILHLPAPACELRLRSSMDLAFLLHGLEFARIRHGYAGQSFNRQVEITVGAGANETLLTTETAPLLRDLIHRLFSRRTIAPGTKPDYRDPLFRLQPERWLESVLRHSLPAIDAELAQSPVYTQVPAFTGGGPHQDRGMLDLLSVTNSGQLALIELKAEEDLHLALQGLDYWIRVRHHHLSNIDPATGLGDLQQHGYFPQQRLRADPPRLYLVAPALRIHPATETILRHLSPRVDWQLIAIDERWRTHIKAVWRKRSSDPIETSFGKDRPSGSLYLGDGNQVDGGSGNLGASGGPTAS